MKWVLIGGVDHGKSTLLARLADESRQSGDGGDAGEPGGRAGVDFALYVNSLAEERKGLYTLDTTQAMINVGGRMIVLIDVPGHAELIKNMVTGASQAEAALAGRGRVARALPDGREAFGSPPAVRGRPLRRVRQQD